MPHDRVPRASERIEEAARWVDLVFAALDREADLFHTTQERCRETLQGFLLRLQVLSVASGDVERLADEIRRFEASFRDTLHAANDAYRAASCWRSRAAGASPRPSPN